MFKTSPCSVSGGPSPSMCPLGGNVMAEREAQPIFVIDEEFDIADHASSMRPGTDTIKVDSVFGGDFTSSGSFDVKEIQTTSFGKLLESLPVPALLIDDAGTVIFTNRSCGKIGPSYKRLEGGPFATLFPDPVEAQNAQALIVKLFTTRQQQVTEAVLKLDQNRIWGRLNLRSVRLGRERSLLVLVEDLTLERKQLILTQKHRKELLDTNEKLRREIAQRKLAEENLRHSFERLETVLEQTAIALASAVEKRDPYTAGHQKRVAQLACAISREMGFSEEEVRGVNVAGILHDIGKICVPAEILSKPAPLNDLEYAMIKSHCQAGYDILQGIHFSWPVAEIVMQHHERIDGSGYPQGLKGDEILLESKILGVADVVESVASHRPYRPSLGSEKAINEIEKNSGILYDHDVVNACVEVFQGGFVFL